jgi:hypothetical protein
MTYLVFDIMIIDEKENLFVIGVHYGEVVGQVGASWHFGSLEVKELSMSTRYIDRDVISGDSLGNEHVVHGQYDAITSV